MGEHVTLVGQTGSGKTTSAIVLLERAANVAPVIVIDTKPEDALEQLPGVIYNNPHEALKSPDWITIYRPNDEHAQPEQVGAFLQAVYEQQRPNLYLYIDETFHAVSRSGRPEEGIANILMRGRSRIHKETGQKLRMSVIASSQRPRWIPLSFWTESTHFFMHHLRAKDDRITMASYIGFNDLLVNNPPMGHNFYYFRNNVEGLTPTLTEWRL